MDDLNKYFKLVDFIKDLDYQIDGFPRWYDFGVKHNSGITTLMLWCQCKQGEPIPHELYQDIGIQTDKGFTALMSWIIHRTGEPIPPELFQELHLFESSGWTPLMHWCNSRKDHIPEELLIYIGHQTKNGITATALWKRNNPNKPLPECLKPEETMELTPFTPPVYRPKSFRFNIL